MISHGHDAGDAAALAPPQLARLLDNKALARIFAAIDRDGDETRVVGGAVRDALAGRSAPKGGASGEAEVEIDLATTAEPQTVVARAEAAGVKAIPTGIDHGTVTLRVDRQSFETTSLREDVETDGRRAQVRYGRDFRADALRRDFTINALYLSKEGKVFDYAGGLQDLAAGRVRFIGEAARRIREDYLRILRFFRFSAEFAGGAFDPEGQRAAIAERAGLARLSRERVRAELLKLLLARRAPAAVREMSDDGLLQPLLASAANPARLARLAALDGAAPDPLLRLAALAVEIPEDAERLGERLRLSNAETRRIFGAATVLVLLKGHSPPLEQALRRLVFLHGAGAAADAILLAAGMAEDPAGWMRARTFVLAEPAPRLPFSGAELVARGLSGRAVGEALERLTQRWIEAGFPSDPQELARLRQDVLRDEESRAR